MFFFNFVINFYGSFFAMHMHIFIRLSMSCVYFKAYLLITMTESFLYVNQQKTDVGINLHLNSHLQPCDIECVR